MDFCDTELLFYIIIIQAHVNYCMCNVYDNFVIFYKIYLKVY